MSGSSSGVDLFIDRIADRGAGFGAMRFEDLLTLELPTNKGLDMLLRTLPGSQKYEYEEGQRRDLWYYEVEWMSRVACRAYRQDLGSIVRVTLTRIIANVLEDDEVGRADCAVQVEIQMNESLSKLYEVV